jgi:hypothetical protein
MLINYLTKIYHSELYVKVMSTNCEKELKDQWEGTDRSERPLAK